MTTPQRRKALIISIHDVAPPHSALVRECMNMLDDIGVPCSSLLVVPRYHGTPLNGDAAFLDWLRGRRDRGDEIVLHGWEHREHGRPPFSPIRYLRRMFLTRGEGEFLGVSRERCEALLNRGMAMLSDADLNAEGFVAPAWLIERDLYPVLRDAGLRYTTRQSAIIDLERGRKISAPTIVLRGSSMTMSKLSRFYSNLLLSAMSSRPVLRVAIHPVDARFGALRWLRRTITALMENRFTLTYGQFISTLSDNQ